MVFEEEAGWKSRSGFEGLKLSAKRKFQKKDRCALALYISDFEWATDEPYYSELRRLANFNTAGEKPET